MKPVRLAPESAKQIIDVFSDAFFDYPVMRFVLGDSSADYKGRLDLLNRLFVMGRTLRDEPLLGIVDDGILIGAATMSYPDKQANIPAAFEQVRETIWSELGSEARSRHELCVAAWAPLAIDVPHLHLNMVGVRRAMHGSKLGRKLLDEVQDISRQMPGSQGVSLTTELPRNVELYQHIGYEVTGHVRVTPDMETWALFRGN
jgi:ribosomal protein S18 acetylase RimI-like enzyme